MSACDAPGTVDVFELARASGVVEGHIQFAAARRLREVLRDGAGAIGFRLEGRTDRQGRASARLVLHADLPLTCDRCGRALMWKLDDEAHFYFVHSDRELAALAVDAAEEAEPLLGSDSFDLAALVEDETILSIPISPRHAECTISADASQAATDTAGANPFAGLADLLRKNGR